jgi:peptidoglycan hydrolase CwlO-like protein
MEEVPVWQDHEERISKLEQNQEAIMTKVDDLSSTVEKGNTKTEKDNLYLREQNNEMIKTLVEINTRSQDRKHELKLLDKQNFWKLTLGIGGSAGVLYTIAQAIIEYLSR